MWSPSRQTLFLLLCVGVLVFAGGTVVAADGVDESSFLWESSEQTTQSTERPVTIIDVQNSTNYLSPDGANVTQSGYEAPSLDVAGAVQGDSTRLQGEHKKLVLEERLDNAADDRTLERETVRTLEEHVSDLEEQQEQLYHEFSEGEIDTTTLFREIVRLGVAAEEYRELVTTAQEHPTVSDAVRLRYANLQGKTVLLPSAFVSHIETELATSGETPLYVQGANESLVMATVEGNTFLREAVMLNERDDSLSDQFGTGNRSEADDAFARAEQLYPWTVSDSSRPELRGFENTSVYRLRAAHSHGNLQTYIDGGTTNPFYEIQEKNPFAVPVTAFSQTTSDGLRLDILLTDPTGPMQVEIIETGDLDYETITVSIDGNEVATLDEGESFYTVQPRGAFEITATTDSGEEVSLFLSPS